MSTQPKRSMDLSDALAVLRRSESFRMVTRQTLGKIILTAVALLLATLSGLFAIDAQSRLLVGLGRESGSGSGQLARLFLLFFSVQFLFELLQWLRRSLQNRVSVSINEALRRRIFEKYSQLKYAELQQVSPGEVAQLHSSDASQLAGVWAEGLLAFLMTLILTLGVSIFLTVQVGVPGTIFFLVLIILIVLAQRFARQMAPALQKRARYSAQRLAVIQEAFRSIFLVKALTAETDFKERTGNYAGLEQDMKLLSNQISCRYVPIFASLRWFAWAALLLWVVYVPAFTQQPVEARTLVALIFAVNWYSGLLQDSFLFVGTYLSFIQVGAVSAQRLDVFLSKPALRSEFTSPEVAGRPTAVLGLDHVAVEYPTRRGQRALDGVSLMVEPGALVVVLGPVGAGKSTLLRTLLGELSPQEGRVIRRTGLRVAYLSQDVVLPSASLRDVLRYEFDNSPHEDEVLRTLLGQAEFGQDLAQMEAGLDTDIGERGVTLSGGQRLRVGLAQLTYFREAEAILLDDPLAALDESTASALTANLICGLWANKTRIVSTHARALAQRADWVVRLEKGRIVEQGPPGSMRLSEVEG